MDRLQDTLDETVDYLKKYSQRSALEKLLVHPIFKTSKISDRLDRIREDMRSISDYFAPIDTHQLLVDMPTAQAEHDAHMKQRFDQQMSILKQLRKDVQKEKEMLAALVAQHSAATVKQAAVSNDPKQWTTIEEDVYRSNPKYSRAEVKKVLEPVRKNFVSAQSSLCGPVLVVDKRQGALSTMAQFHLEYLRLHALLRDRNFLTSRVEAAGYMLESDLTKRAVTTPGAVNFALDLKQVGAKRALDTVGTSYGVESHALELIRLSKRIANDQYSHAVKVRHFVDYDHILCFNEPTYQALRALRTIAGQMLKAQASKQKLKGWITLLPVSYEQARLPQTFADMKTALNGWVAKEWDWTPPSELGSPAMRIQAKPTRARQFFIRPDPAGREGERERTLQKNMDRLKQEAGVETILAHWQGYSTGTLVTVVGPLDNLEGAEKKVKACCMNG
jgi:hypothetical protein